MEFTTDPFQFDQDFLRTHLLSCLSFDLANNLSGKPTGELSGDLRLAGVDEVGRGCLAGPLVAAAVVLDYSRIFKTSEAFPSLCGLTDSKKLSSGTRENLFASILNSAYRVSWVAISSQTIDEVGLHKCNMAALAHALELLDDSYKLAIVDGFDLKRSDLYARRLVKADSKSAVVAAASVLAKVVRDRLMRTLDFEYPQYGFAKHMGYATKLHKEALQKFGPCSLHRLSFRGVVVNPSSNIQLKL